MNPVLKPILIEELNSSQNKTVIAKYVLKNASISENEALAHQLYMYQTYILR